MIRLWPFSKKSVGGAGRALFLNSVANFFTRNPRVFADEGYIKNAIAFACINKIAVSVASIDFNVVKKLPNGKNKTLDNHPLKDLLKRPNPMNGEDAFFEALVSYRLIAGNAYICRLPDSNFTEQPVELWLLRPDQTRLVTTSQGRPKEYRYKVQDDEKVFPIDPITMKSDVLQIKSFHPLNDLYGLSPMEAASYSIDTFNSAQRWNKALLDNQATPSGALIFNPPDGTRKTLTEDQLARIQEQLEKRWMGDRNAGKPIILEGGMDWKELGINPRDMNHEKNLLNAARFVASVYGVPPQLVNIPGESTYNNLAEAKLSLWQDTVIPLTKSILTELNHWLAPMFGDDIEITFDENNINALEPRREARFDRINQATFLTINEKRKMVDLDPVIGGDVMLVAAGQLPLDMVANAQDMVHYDPNSAAAPGSKTLYEWLLKNGYNQIEASRLVTLASRPKEAVK